MIDSILPTPQSSSLGYHPLALSTIQALKKGSASTTSTGALQQQIDKALLFSCSKTNPKIYRNKVSNGRPFQFFRLIKPKN